jgi:SpoVK/Ycf46/Vps4 family AAA+-type ATPase
MLKVAKEKKKKEIFQEQQVTMADFIKAVSEVKPAFGASSSGLENKLLGGFYNYGITFNSLLEKCRDFVNDLRTSTNT